MAKNIVLCADGTWNGPGCDDNHDGVPDVTNVLKLFIQLEGVDSLDTYRLADEQERILYDPHGNIIQIAKYIHGVGDSRNPLSRLLGGGVGLGVVERIARGYTFLSRNYQPGDAIYLIGFSRGSYTVRALAGMVATVGLMDTTDYDPDNKDEAYCLAENTWEWYRRDRLDNKKSIWEKGLSGLFSFKPHHLTDRVPRLVPDVPIKAIGVWDTVGAMGIPEFHDGERIDAYRFADLALNSRVEYGFHAVSIDERRVDFSPTLWQPRQGVEQVLFAGAHADVGGGYPRVDGESGLSDIALVWMYDKLASIGLRVIPLQAQIQPNPLGVAHKPWLDAVWFGHPSGERTFSPASGLVVHSSVLARIKAASVKNSPDSAPSAYSPANLP